MTYPIVRLPPLAAPVDQLWHVLLNLSEQLTVPWTLVGGQRSCCMQSSAVGFRRRSVRTAS